MVNRKKNPNGAKAKLLFILPIAMLLIFFFGIRDVSGMQMTGSQPNMQDTIKVAQAQEEIYEKVEKEPAYQGGDAARLKFLSKNIKYPADQTEKGVEGTVYVKFVVEKDGSISNIEVTKGVSQELDEEAIRVTRLMPKWTPGMQDGKSVRVFYVMPIKFELAKDYPKVNPDEDTNLE